MSHPVGGQSGLHPAPQTHNSPRSWAFERGSFWEMDLTTQSLDINSRDQASAAVFSEVHREQADFLAKAMGLPDQSPVLRRLANGKRCFVCCLNGEIAVYGWVSRSVECIGELEHEIQLPTDEAYIWDCATLPQYRRHGLYTALLKFSTARLQKEGIKRVWIGSALENLPSLRGFASAGFRPVITVFFARLMSLSGLWVSGDPSAPRSLVETARQILTANWKRHWGLFVFERALPGQLPAISRSSCSDGNA